MCMGRDDLEPIKERISVVLMLSFKDCSMRKEVNSKFYLGLDNQVKTNCEGGLDNGC